MAVQDSKKKKNIENVDNSSLNQANIVENENNDLVKEEIKLDNNGSGEIILNEDNDNRKSFFKSKYFFIIIAIIILSALGFVFCPKIYINGSDKVIISYDKEYVEDGYNAFFLGKDITANVKVDSNIQNGKIGNYKITYYIKYMFIKFKAERYVFVVDDKGPNINTEVDIIKVCPNKEIPKLEYKVIDGYDGDITENVIENIYEDKITLSVSDSSNNLSQKTISINRIDNEGPKISLKGNSTVYLDLTEKYKEPGYSAVDNCDGDITSKVLINGTVGSKMGTYKISYSVTDASGNRSEVVRKVIVINKNIINNGSVSNGSIYLTFDDGPNQGTTNVILDVLKEEGVKATFFVTCNGPNYLIKRIHDEGHALALHTATHNYKYIYSSTDNYFSDLNKVSNRVKNITGIDSKIIRFPGGSSNTVSRNYKKGIMTELSYMVLSKGYRYYDWNIDSMDASTARSGQDVYNNVVSHLSKNRVNMVLMHDTKKTTRDAIRNIIRYGKSNGYSFKTIDMNTYMIKHGINN